MQKYEYKHTQSSNKHIACTLHKQCSKYAREIQCQSSFTQRTASNCSSSPSSSPQANYVSLVEHHNPEEIFQRKLLNVPHNVARILSYIPPQANISTRLLVRGSKYFAHTCLYQVLSDIRKQMGIKIHGIIHLQLQIILVFS